MFLPTIDVFDYLPEVAVVPSLALDEVENISSDVVNIQTNSETESKINSIQTINALETEDKIILMPAINTSEPNGKELEQTNCWSLFLERLSKTFSILKNDKLKYFIPTVLAQGISYKLTFFQTEFISHRCVEIYI